MRTLCYTWERGALLMWPLNGKCKHHCCIELGTKYLPKVFIYSIYIHTELRTFIWRYEENISTEWSINELEDNFF